MTERTRILTPYTRHVDDLRHRLRKVTATALLLMTAMAIGLLIAIFPVQMIIVPLLPIIVLAAIALWMMPHIEPQIDRAIILTLFVYMAVGLSWPEYIAITIPGIGWAPFDRIAMAWLVLISLYALTSSPRLRGEVKDVISVDKLVLYAFLGFILLQLVVNIANAQITDTWVKALIFWYYGFLISAWVFAHRGAPRIFYVILLTTMALQGIYSVAEFHNKNPIWAAHIPAFMNPDPALLSKFMFTNWQQSLRGYRVHGIFMTSLTYAEYFSLMLPFAVHGVYFASDWKRRLFALSLVVLTVTTAFAFTDQRTGVIGVFIALAGYPALWALYRLRHAERKRDLLGTAALWGYPFFASLVVGLIFSSNTLYYRVFGGNAQKASDIARDTQWAMAVERFKSNPFGYGNGRAASVVGFKNPGYDNYTLDNYRINLLIDYGPLAWVFFFGFFALLIYISVRTLYYAETDEERLAAPLAISLFSFVIIRMVLSQRENFALVYVLAGLVVGIAWMQKQRRAGLPGLGGIPKAKRRHGRAFGGTAQPA